MEQRKLIGLLRLPVAFPPKHSDVCPDDHQLAAYVDGLLADPDCRRFEQHLADCDLCIGRVGFLSSLRNAEPAEPVPEMLLARARRMGTASGFAENRNLRHWAAAAAIVLAVMGVFYSNSMREVAVVDGEIRTSRTLPAATVNSLMPRVLSPDNGATVDLDNLLVSWTDVPGSLYYSINIVNDEGDLVWEDRVADTQWVPQSDMQLSAGAEYYIRVDAYVAEAKTISSNHVVIRISEP